MATVVEAGLRSQLLDRRGRLTTLSASQPGTYLRDLLSEVDAALERMEGGTFGICEVCSDPVETDRLLADPLCRLCLDHLSERERRALEHDLEMASRIQAGLLPAREVSFPNWQVRTHYHPAGMVSGDYLDLIRSGGDADEAVFLFGDISGKGVSASLLMASLHAIFRSLAPLGLPLEDLLERANRVFCEHTLPSTYATLVCGRVEAGGRSGWPTPATLRRCSCARGARRAWAPPACRWGCSAADATRRARCGCVPATCSSSTPTASRRPPTPLGRNTAWNASPPRCSRCGRTWRSLACSPTWRASSAAVAAPTT